MPLANRIDRNVCTEFVTIIKIDERSDLTRDKVEFTVALRSLEEAAARRDIDDGLSLTGRSTGDGKTRKTRSVSWRL